MNDRLTLEIVKTRCARCGLSTHVLIPPHTRTIDNVIPQLRCGRVVGAGVPPHAITCAGALVITSARGVAHRTVTVGEGPRWNVAEPDPLELLGAKPGRVRVPRGDR